MRKTDKEKIIENRKQVSRLIYMVLAENLLVREALLKYPDSSSDLTLKAAYHALVHREADEDLRRKDIDYREEQDDFLEFIAQILNEGHELPKNIIKGYEKYYKDISIKYSDGAKGLLKRLCKFLNV